MTEREMIDQFIRERGVTRCPAAMVAYTQQVRLSDADIAAHHRHNADMRAIEQSKTKGLMKARAIGARRGGQSRWAKAKAR